MNPFLTTAQLLAVALLWGACDDDLAGVSSDGGPDGSPVVDSRTVVDARTGDGDSLPPSNGSCAHAEDLVLADHKASVTASTAGASNEFNDQVTCDYCRALAGPQVYYALTLATGMDYTFRLDPSFQAQLYLVRDEGCNAAAINADCSPSLNGARETFSPGSEKKMTFRPSTAGRYLLVVDSVEPLAAGTFQLDVDGVENNCPIGECCGGSCGAPCQSGPRRDRCSGALELASDVTEFEGDSQSCASNEFDDAITCGTAGSFEGSQKYYRLELTAGRRYTFTATAHYGMGRLYLFGVSCDPVQIEADCSSAGNAGAVSAEIVEGTPAALSFTPSRTGTFHLVIDGACPSESGAYSIEIASQAP